MNTTDFELDFHTQYIRDELTKHDVVVTMNSVKDMFSDKMAEAGFNQKYKQYRPLDLIKEIEKNAIDGAYYKCPAQKKDRSKWKIRLKFEDAELDYAMDELTAKLSLDRPTVDHDLWEHMHVQLDALKLYRISIAVILELIHLHPANQS